MKKIVCMILACMMTAVLLAGCGSDNKKTPETAAQNQTTVSNAGQETQPETAQAASDAFTFVYKGTNIAMHEDASPILEVLGDPKSYTEEDSCAFPGELDRNYTYTSFVLTTYPDGDGQRVNSVSLMDDTVGTADGISIGDSKEKVEGVYGSESFNGVNAYIMTNAAGDAQLTIIMENDKVSSVQYAALFK